VLAAIRDFLYPWQLIHLTIFAIGWIGGGGWMLLRSLKKANYPKRIKLINCVGLVILAGATAAVTGLVLFMMVHRLTASLPTKLSMLSAAIVAAAVMAATALAVIYAMLDLSFRKSVRVAIVPLALLFVLGAALAADAGVRSVRIRRATLLRQKCLDNLTYIQRALQTYQRNTGQPAPSLQVLVDEDLLERERLSCPAAGGTKIGYFYYPTRLTDPTTFTTKLLLCDYKHNHADARNVMRTTGQLGWSTDSEFQELLQEDHNKDFAAALRQAEASTP